MTTEVSIGDCAQFVGLVIAGVGLFLNARETRRATAQRRVAQVIDFRNRLHSDPQMFQMYYRLEHKKFQYGESFKGSEDEKALDCLLQYFDGLARLYLEGFISLKEFSLVSFYYRKIFEHPGVKQYVSKLHKSIEKKNYADKPFGAFEKVGIELFGE